MNSDQKDLKPQLTPPFYKTSFLRGLLLFIKSQILDMYFKKH